MKLSKKFSVLNNSKKFKQNFYLKNENEWLMNMIAFSHTFIRPVFGLNSYIALMKYMKFNT